MNQRAQRLAAWCGPGICIIFSLGALALARYIPPHISPEASAERAQEILAGEATRVRLGLALMLTGMAIMPAWGASIVTQLRKSEGRYGVLAYTQLASLSVGSALACCGCIVWGASAFRAGDLDPEFARFGTDLGWHFFLWAWQPFSVWAIAMGMAIIGAKDSVYPRWSAYVCFWTAFLFSAATGLTFFKSGPFAYSGLLTLWMVMSVFFIWIIVMTVLTLKNCNDPEFYEPDEGPVGPDPALGDRALSDVAIRSTDSRPAPSAS